MASPGSARPASRARSLLAVTAALAAALAVAGCVSLPSAGPVHSYSITQGAGAQNQPYQQTITGPPGKDWSPRQIVEGFLIASASFGDHWRVARSYLTPDARKVWQPSWTATVYKKGPKVKEPVYPASGDRNRASVTITGKVQANLSGDFYFKYAVPSASTPDSPDNSEPTFQLAKVHGQWRISSAPSKLLLTRYSFHLHYQLRNLYFFDPTNLFLVPDPVYVPLQATPEVLMNSLVRDLISQPADWLANGATQTAFPANTKLVSDTLDGVTAVINLGGAVAKASPETLQRISAQLYWTLVGSGQAGQAVQSVEVQVNGRPWSPGGSQGNPVQRETTYTPPDGASKTFYYLDEAGNVIRRAGTQGKPAQIEHIGTGFSQIAVSPEGKYLAALKGGILYTGLLGSTLAQRGGTGYATMSWGPNGDLWVTTAGQNNKIFMLRGDATTKKQLNRRFPVSVFSSDGSVVGPCTALRVAPDGVRVAVVIDNTTLNFGAISRQRGAKPGESTWQIVFSPFYVTGLFTSLTWYGSDNVITLAEPGQEVTEYPVNGGQPQPIPSQPRMSSISASAGSPLIAGLRNGRVMADASLTGSWTPVTSGDFPVYPG